MNRDTNFIQAEQLSVMSVTLSPGLENTLTRLQSPVAQEQYIVSVGAQCDCAAMNSAALCWYLLVSRPNAAPLGVGNLTMQILEYFTSQTLDMR